MKLVTRIVRTAAVVVAVAASTTAIGGSAHAALQNGLSTTQSRATAGQASELQAMMLKYVARCALRADQFLDGPADASGKRSRFPGSMGVAPEWLDGTCDHACEEKVSSCLIALTNRTGKHVMVSMISAAPTMGADLVPGDNDIAFPHQEGAFFGNVFTGEAYSCRGRDAAKGAQVKRFCALEPDSCSGLAQFSDAGLCEEACEMTCSPLADGTQRCAAASCKDPSGRRWAFPITTYLRNQIEAGNADRLEGSRARNEAVEPLAGRGAIRYERVDFGATPGVVHTFTARLAARDPGARIEVWLEDERRLGTLEVASTGGVEKDQSAAVDTSGVEGPHAVVLKIFGARKVGRLSTIEFH